MPAAISPTLVVAHPGHELLLHHWMEEQQPTVHALTDGSGGAGEDRRHHSHGVITAAGGAVGSIFGFAPDRQWYDWIRQAEISPFRRVIEMLVVDGERRGSEVFVTDPIEYFNPMHDLCNAMACAVVRRLRGRGRTAELLDYCNERPDLKTAEPAWRAELPNDALEHKWRAIEGYAPLRGDVVRRDDGSEIIAVERLYRAEVDQAWPNEAPEVPHYERVGAERVAMGRFSATITYRNHVRPLAEAIRRLGEQP